jgi:2-hydroxy-3-keto-5-methylthiopentenyl-1-phosphate phosphatase
MLQSVSVEKSLKECIELLLENIELDPGFVTFFSWCLENDIPVVVLSSGMEPVIRALLTKLVGPTTEKIEIVANNVDIKSDGSWKIIFRDNR